MPLALVDRRASFVVTHALRFYSNRDRLNSLMRSGRVIRKLDTRTVVGPYCEWVLTIDETAIGERLMQLGENKPESGAGCRVIDIQAGQ